MAQTLLLDTDTWDLTLDPAGNMALADARYSIAQDVASAVSTWSGECWYDNSLGLPYKTQILGQKLAESLVKAQIKNAALTIDGVSQVTTIDLQQTNRKLSGTIEIIDASGVTAGVTF